MRPAEMILDAQVVPARFTLLPEFDATELPGEGDAAIPLAAWLAFEARGADVGSVGLIAEGHQSIDPLHPHLGKVPFVALHLPSFRDGRIYTHARKLRGIWGYQGMILAYGDVQRDQLLYLNRVGVNAFYMREGSDLRASLAAFSLYGHFYQHI